MEFKLLFIGDIAGVAGRKAVKHFLPGVIEQYKPDFVIANGENATHGHGISKQHAEELMKLGIHFYTGGNHSYYGKEHMALLNSNDPIAIRPANFPPGGPGRGFKIIDTGMKQFAIINLQGQVFMNQQVDCPYRKLEQIIKEELVGEHIDGIFIDFHAEATSEKKAMFYFAEKFEKVVAISGTHTHVQTNDAQIGDTQIGYITDAGMCGAYRSIIGVQVEPVLKKMLLQTPQKYTRDDTGGLQFNGVLFTIDGQDCQNVEPISLVHKY